MELVMLVVTALVTGLAAGAKSVIFQAVRDFYESRWGGGRRQALGPGEEPSLEPAPEDEAEEDNAPGEASADEPGGSAGRRPSRHAADQAPHYHFERCRYVQTGDNSIQSFNGDPPVEVRNRGRRA
ncbi:hypothetical protein [Streptomyces collinus]|uniref:hypothetical protein n=1 Tax=Streptomyces collinus TaxID=42684 RepID=UPI0036E5AF35